MTDAEPKARLSRRKPPPFQIPLLSFAVVEVVRERPQFLSVKQRLVVANTSRDTFPESRLRLRPDSRCVMDFGGAHWGRK